MRLKIQDGILQNPDGDDSCFTTWVKILPKLENRIPNAIFWKKKAAFYFLKLLLLVNGKRVVGKGSWKDRYVGKVDVE